jgi:hypothetical protein
MAPFALIFTIFLMSCAQQVSAADAQMRKLKPASEVPPQCVKAFDKCKTSYAEVNSSLSNISLETRYKDCISTCAAAIEPCNMLDSQHSHRLTPQSYKMQCSKQLRELQKPSKKQKQEM